MSARAVWSSILRTFRTFRTTFLVGLLAFITIMLAMGPFGFLVIPGVLGGLIAALIMVRRHRFGSQPPTSVPPHAVEEDMPPTDVINAARIRVSGIGGLGLVAMCGVIAIALPQVGGSILVGFIGGAIAAWGIVSYRQKRGPISSSGRGLPGARTLLVEDGDGLPGPEGPGLHAKDSERHSRFVTPAVVKTA
jgi:hypothetical protein